MILIIPFFISFLFYLLKSDEYNIDINLYYGILSILLILNECLYFTSETVLIILIIILTFYWIKLNEDKKLIGSVFIFSSYLVISCTSLFSFFISIEILSFIMIILINLYILNKYPSILYYLFSSIFSALLIISLGYLYMGYMIGYKILNIVFIYKLSLAPFHILLIRIYNNISIRIIFLIDINYKILLFYLFYKISIFIINFIPFIILTLLIGSFGVIIYRNLLNIMIYSSLFHYGLIMINIYLGHWDYFIIYLIIYSFTVLIYLYLIIFKFLNYNNFNFNNYYLIFWFILIMNLIGIPPLSGFFIKFFTLYAVISNHFYILFFIISIGILPLTYIYLRILLSIFFSNTNNNISNNILFYNNNNFISHFISSLLLISSLPLFI
jgi:NADH:ubiquinone oxidoreductase subunit 2 (subunit N)